MLFEELWAEVQRYNMLPEAAIEIVPSLLSETTKKIRDNGTL